MSSDMKQLVVRMLKKSASIVLASFRSSTGTRPPHNSAARTDVVLLIRRTVSPRGYASGFDSPAALLNGLFEHPAGFHCCPSCANRSSTATNWFYLSLLGSIMVLACWSVGSVWPEAAPPLSPRNLVVALDGNGAYASLQTAVDPA